MSFVCIGAAGCGGALWYHQYRLHVQVSGHMQDTGEYWVLLFFAVEKSKKEHGQHILNEHQFKFPLIILSMCSRILTVRSPSCRWDSTGLLGNMKVGIKF